MFILTPVDENITPLNRIPRGLSTAKDFTYTLSLWKGTELEVYRPT
jgi:hypothetical protein